MSPSLQTVSTVSSSRSKSAATQAQGFHGLNDVCQRIPMLVVGLIGQQLAERLFCLLAPSRNEDHPDAARDLQDSFFGRRGPLSCFVRARQEGRIFWTLEEIKAIFSSPFLDVSSRLCLTASASLSRCPSSCLLLTSLSSGLSRDKERKRNVLLPQNFLRLVREQWNAGLGEITRAHMGALARDVQPLDLMGVRERALPDEQFSEVLQTVSDSDNCTNSSSSGLLSSMPCSAFFLICRKHCRFKSIGVSQALRTDALLDHEPLDPHSLATSDLPRHAALAPQEHSRNG